MLKRSTMPSKRPRLRAIEAAVYVADVEAACDCSVSKLGFVVDFVHGEPPFYGRVHRNGARRNVRRIEEPVFAGPATERVAYSKRSATIGSKRAAFAAG